MATFTPGAQRLLGLGAKDKPKQEIPDQILIDKLARNAYFQATAVILNAEDPKPKAALEITARVRNS
ncbi:MAG: hypothetical protein AB7V32_05085 [Candidatus Berkiella sp.]